MPTKTRGKSSAKKAAKRKPAKKAVKKKTPAKKSPPGKKAATKKPLKKKVVKKPLSRTAAKETGRPPAMPVLSATEVTVEPGPPPGPLPPLEEPARNEVALGTVTHYYSHLNVAVVQINTGELRTGATIHIKGHSTDFMQTIESMEYEHRHIDLASAGQSVGIKVKDHAREHDIVYLVG